jgi:outer membrane PBP1 activator LpoA protein
MRRPDEDGQMMRKKGTRTVYRIVARSELGDRYAAAFDGMHMETNDGETILTGELKDQSHLFGILDRINGLGVELLSVQPVPDDAHQRAERDLEPKP